VFEAGDNGDVSGICDVRPPVGQWRLILDRAAGSIETDCTRHRRRRIRSHWSDLPSRHLSITQPGRPNQAVRIESLLPSLACPAIQLALRRVPVDPPGSHLLHRPEFRAARGVTGERGTALPAKRPGRRKRSGCPMRSGWSEATSMPRANAIGCNHASLYPPA
jgi:hypothetical protein